MESNYAIEIIRFCILIFDGTPLSFASRNAIVAHAHPLVVEILTETNVNRTSSPTLPAASTLIATELSE